jgi:hypothetical protein
VIRSSFIPTLCASLLSLVTAPLQAETDNDWQFAAKAYLWAADIGGSTGAGDSVDVSFSDVFDNLNAGFMGAFEARKDKWLVLTDLIYLDVSADDKTTVSDGPFPVDIEAKTDVDLTGTIFQLAGGYNLLSEEPLELYLLAGARYLNLETDITVDLSAIGPGQSAKFSDSDNVWDGIIGMKGKYDFGNRWSVALYGDIGTGESDFTWQAAAGVVYHTERADVALLYRHLEWELDEDLIDDINFSGPAVGAVFRW